MFYADGLQMHASGCVGCRLKVAWVKERKISHFYTLLDLYMKEHIRASRDRKQYNNGISSLYRLDFEVQ